MAWGDTSPLSDSFWSRIWPTAPRFTKWLNRGLPASVRIRMKVRWPILLIPLALLNQIFAPHAVWIVLLISLLGFYTISLLWVRAQAPLVTVERERFGTILIAGDILHEEFELRNQSRLPVLWAEFVDESELPGYNVGRVIACGAGSFYRWRSEVTCEQRGVFRLGPHHLNFGDPFGLFAVESDHRYIDMVLIYPRVVKLPPFELPHGNARGTDRRRRPLRGSLPAASVSDYRPGDSLRYIHWPSTARRSRLTVKDLEIEPSGDVWIVLDLNRCVQSGEGPMGTLEHGVVLAASLSAELLAEGERRAVGLFTISGDAPGVSVPSNDISPGPTTAGEIVAQNELANSLESPASKEVRLGKSSLEEHTHSVIVPPQSGRAQLWRILSALAPVQASEVPLATMLHSGRDVLGRSRTLIVITPETSSVEARLVKEMESLEVEISASHEPVASADAPLVTIPESADWLAKLLHLQSSGLDSSVLFVTPGDQEETVGSVQKEAHGDHLRGMLAQYDIPAHIMRADSTLQPILTFRRTKTVIRSTPSGGVVTYEVEEEVG